MPVAEVTIDPITILVAFITLIGGQSIILLALTLGMRAFKAWFMTQVVNPHISPIKTDVTDIKTEQQRQGVILNKHDRDIDKFRTYTLLLLGKVFGGVPNLDVVDALDEPHTSGETPLIKRETPPHA